ncbi:MAG: hypothetical protein A2X86_12940 [Bdellovibrionales bacterium GWA2_49_15]|nr:MAG: hypothetical protein A2X86_12940 [Bdellovibrionales bacterium GWA2_49_15]HAZ13891.1 hypothetical protein [Bdellovibrionales bacterium]
MTTAKTLLGVFLIFSWTQAFAGDLSSALKSFEGVSLYDGSVISRGQISKIKFAADRDNKIEFLELKDSTYIDSADIEKVHSNLSELSRLSDKLDGKLLRFAKSSGDGSGG